MEAIAHQPEVLEKNNWWARWVSYLLHPLFLPSLITAYIVFAHPVYRLLLGRFTAMQAWISVTLNTVLYPALLVFLLWRLKFIESIQLRTQKERIVPLVVNILFYFWAWYVSRNVETFPLVLRQWLMGIFLSSCAAMFTNIFMKMSLHAIGWGGVAAFCILQQANDANWPQMLTPVVLVLAGLVGTARLALGAHKPGEVYGGFLAGAISIVMGWLIAS